VVRFDLSTVYLTMGIVSVALVLAMATVALTRKTYSGFGRWTVATLLLTLGMTFIGLRDRVPSILSVIFGNIAILAALVLIYDGLRSFIDLPPKRRCYAIPAVALILPYIVFTYVYPFVAVRQVVSSLVFGSMSGTILHLQLRHAAGHYPDNWLLPVGLAVQAGLLVLRIGDVLATGTVRDYMASGPVEGILVIVSYSASILIIIGLIVLNSQRTERDLQSAMAEVKTLRGIVPICSSCKRIRDDDGYWNAVETYVHEHTEAQFSHSLCPDCAQRLYPEYAESTPKKRTERYPER